MRIFTTVQGDTCGRGKGSVECFVIYSACYCSCPAAQLVIGTFYLNVNKSFSVTTCVTLHCTYNLVPDSLIPILPEFPPRSLVSPNAYVNGVAFSVRDVLGLDVDLGHVGRGTQPKSRAVLTLLSHILPHVSLHCSLEIVGPRPPQSCAQERVHGRQDGAQLFVLPLPLLGGRLRSHAVHDRHGSEVLDGKGER